VIVIHLVWRHHLVLRALEQNHRAVQSVDGVDRRALLVQRRVLRVPVGAARLSTVTCSKVQQCAVECSRVR
jgi:hypothetical protein